MGFVHRHRRLTPSLLLGPGLAWLALFFVAPLGFLAHQSLEVQDPIALTYTFKWAWHNYADAITTYHTQLLRSFEYAGLATAIALAISYPLAYWIAFRGGRWKNLLLLFINGPFFVTYLIRTLAWETIPRVWSTPTTKPSSARMFCHASVRIRYVTKKGAMMNSRSRFFQRPPRKAIQ